MSQNGDVVVRRLRDDDLRAWWRLRAAAMPDAPPDTIKTFTRHFQGDRMVAVVAEIDGGLVGLAEMAIAADPGIDGRSVGYLTLWHVAEDHRRRGIGRRLVDEVESWARHKRAGRIESAVVASDEVSAMAHRALGFSDGGVLRRFSKALDTPAQRRTPDGDIRLVEIDENNVRAICDLRVAPHQQSFVAPNAVSIAQAGVSTQVWMRAAYVGEEPVGFAMLSDGFPNKETGSPRYYLWRFMIDERYQGVGLGRQVMNAVERYVASRPSGDTMYLSVVDAPGSAHSFYAGLGYTPTGRVHELEIEMVKTLTSADPSARGEPGDA